MVAAGFGAAIGVFVSPPPSNRRRSRVSRVAVVRARPQNPSLNRFQTILCYYS